MISLNITSYKEPRLKVQCNPKNGRKLLLGKKHTVLGEKISQEDDHQKKEMPDFENLDWNTGCPLIDSALIDPSWHLKTKKSGFPDCYKYGI